MSNGIYFCSVTLNFRDEVIDVCCQLADLDHHKSNIGSLIKIAWRRSFRELFRRAVPSSFRFLSHWKSSLVWSLSSPK